PVVAAPQGVAASYGVTERFAVFVIASNGTIAWHYVADGTMPPPSSISALAGLSRREFLAAMLAASVAAGFTSKPVDAFTVSEAPTPTAANTLDIAFVVNGRPAHLTLDPRVTLLDALREHLHLTGSKKGCDHGQCGACTVLVNGRRINSCLSLAVTHEGDEITTIEGLAKGDELHPVQAAFLEHDGFQCGYCTPGQICSAVACISEGHTKSDAEIREWMSGNLCRCGAYPNIVAAVKEAQIKTPAKAS